jgi:cytochrome c biogenesis protein CcmG/thiol:disulfide interchange protein DsbE
MKQSLAIFIIMAVLCSACSIALPSGPSPEVGSVAPEFALADLDGNQVSLSDLRGQVVLLNFWATWCGPCRLEMPAIQQRYNDGGFAVLAVDFNEDADRVQAFVDELALDLPILLDPGGRIQELYRVRGYPTSFFVDEAGVIRVFHIGEMTQEILDDYLTQMGVQP